MMEKIFITDASIAEEIRKQMTVATERNNGLMSYEDKGRYIPYTVTSEGVRFIKLAVLNGQASFVCLLNFGRVEGEFTTTHCLSAYHNSIGGGDAQLNKISGGGISFSTYKKIIENGLEIYIDTALDFNYIEGLALSYTGGTKIVIEKQDKLPDGCIQL